MRGGLNRVPDDLGGRLLDLYPTGPGERRNRFWSGIPEKSFGTQNTQIGLPVVPFSPLDYEKKGCPYSNTGGPSTKEGCKKRPNIVVSQGSHKSGVLPRVSGSPLQFPCFFCWVWAPSRFVHTKLGLTVPRCLNTLTTGFVWFPALEKPRPDGQSNNFPLGLSGQLAWSSANLCGFVLVSFYRDSPKKSSLNKLSACRCVFCCDGTVLGRFVVVCFLQQHECKQKLEPFWHCGWADSCTSWLKLYTTNHLPAGFCPATDSDIHQYLDCFRRGVPGGIPAFLFLVLA